MELDVTWTIKLKARVTDNTTLKESLSEMTGDEKARLDYRLKEMGREVAEGSARALYSYIENVDPYSITYDYPIDYEAVNPR